MRTALKIAVALTIALTEVGDSGAFPESVNPNLKYYGYDSLTWDMGTHYQQEAAVIQALINRGYIDWEQHFVTTGPWTTLTNQNTTTAATKLASCTCFSLSGHGGINGTLWAFEYYTGTFRDGSWVVTGAQLVRASAAAQGLIEGEDYTVVQVGYGWGQINTCQGLALTATGVAKLFRNVSRGEKCILVADMCFGKQFLNAMISSSNEIGIGPDAEVDPIPLANEIDTMFRRFGCENVNDEFVDSVLQAYGAGGIYLLKVVNPSSTDLRLDWCSSCATDPAMFAGLRCADGQLEFLGRFERIARFDVVGYGADTDWGSVCATLSPGESGLFSADSTYFSCEVGQQFMCYEVFAYGPYGEVGRSGRVWNGALRIDSDIFGQEMVDLGWVSGVWNSSTGSGGTPLKIVRGESEKSLGVDALVVGSDYSMVVPIAGQLSNYGKSYELLFGTALEAIDIRNEYVAVYHANIVAGGEPPMLILVGSPSVSNYSVPYGFVEDPWDLCGMAGCQSDYWYTDVDSDAVPDGPVTRVPAISPAEVARAVENSAIYRMGDGDPQARVDILRRVAFVADDPWRNYYNTVADIRQRFFEADVTSLGILRSSDYGSFDDRAQALAEVLNAGAAELFVRGYGSYTQDFFGFLSSLPSRSWSISSLEREQIIIAWAPACHSVFQWDFYEDGVFVPQPSVLRQLFHGNQGTRLAAMVGSYGYANMDHSDIYSRYIAEARAAAELEEDTVADIAFRAARAMAIEYPELRPYVMGLGVAGGYVILPARSAVSGVRGDAGSRGNTVRFENTPQHAVALPSGAAGDVSIKVYDVRGRLVCSTSTTVGQLGGGRWVWDGRDDKGTRVASGVYLCRVDLATLAANGKFVLVR